MSATEARSSLAEAKLALEGAFESEAGRPAMVRAYGLVRAALLRLDPLEAPELVAAAAALLEEVSLIARTIRTMEAPPAAPRTLRLVTGGGS